MLKSFGKKSSKKTTEPIEVAVIGCGPAGMSFLHAYHEHAKKDPHLKENVKVTCFERAPSAGGLWRDVPKDDVNRSQDENKATMYSDLWCNRPKELMEYYDYTFAQHFHNKPTPTFLPRKDILEYMIARNSVDGALDDVKYNHTVLSVLYNDSSEKFEITVKDGEGGTSMTSFDRCIWAAGINGYLEDPDSIDELLEDYTGKVLHSSEAYETPTFAQHVTDKTLMFIGDNASAEDLALRCIKLKAKKIYICSRSENGLAADTKSFPGKVEMVWGLPYKVIKETGFKCQNVYWSEKRLKYRKDDDEEPVKVKHVDTVIQCTGYNPNLEMLEKKLRFDPDKTWEIKDKNWVMDNNAFTISIGNVKPSKLLTCGATVYPEVYRGILISNPNFMYIMESDDSESNLLEIDVNAHLILSYLTGTTEIPKEKDMVKANDKQLHAEMQIPWLRSGMDRAYLAELADLDEKHWSENAEDERCVKLERECKEFKAKILSRDMKAAKYPLDFGPKPEKLNDDGNKFVDMLIAANKTRSTIPSSDKDWRTYRDVQDPSVFTSLYSGMSSSPLPKHWLKMKLDKDDEEYKIMNLM